MNIIIFILLILLLNTILGCLAIYIEFGKVTLFDLIMCSLVGVFVFFVMTPTRIFDWIEDKTYHITLFEKLRKNER